MTNCIVLFVIQPISKSILADMSKRQRIEATSSNGSDSDGSSPAWSNPAVVPEISDGFVYRYPWTLFGYARDDILPDTVDLLESRLHAGDIRANVNIGWCYQFGVCGHPRNVVKAVEYYRTATRYRVDQGDHNSGDRMAWFNYGVMLLDG
jgi:TPR repeat protein